MDYEEAKDLASDQVSCKFAKNLGSGPSGLEETNGLASRLCLMFGLLLWEMFTHEELSYSKMKGDHVREKIKAGYPLSKLKCCPQAICTIMTKCWMSVPDERLEFSVLALKLMEHRRGSKQYYTIVH